MDATLSGIRFNGFQELGAITIIQALRIFIKKLVKMPDIGGPVLMITPIRLSIATKVCAGVLLGNLRCFFLLLKQMNIKK